MAAYLLDTNHVGLAVNRTTIVGQRVYEARLAGLRLGTCLPVLCEIEAGMRQVRRKAQYRRDLDHLLLQLRVWPIDRKTTQLYGDIYFELRRRGKAISQVDIMVAAGAADEADDPHHGSRLRRFAGHSDRGLVEEITFVDQILLAFAAAGGRIDIRQTKPRGKRNGAAKSGNMHIELSAPA